jgi:DNA sulfur modification protein DndD
MIIRTLSIQNFGPFRNAKFNLEPSSAKKSVVLVGGENGFGKTTLLNSIKLCLYGKRATELWGGPNLQAYRQYITKLFNNQSFAENEREMSIELGLVVFENRIRHELTVKRCFHLTDSRAFQSDNQETLQVLRDGTPLPIADQQVGDVDVGNDYDTLLRALIPAHFARFYFFDAERMRHLFERLNPQDIAQAVRDLLGLSVFERLAGDMRDYRKSKIPALFGKHAERQAELAKKLADKAAVKAELQRLEDVVSDLEEQLSDLSRKLEQREADFRKLGGVHREELDKLKAELGACDLEYDALTGQLKEAITGRFSSCFLLPLKADIEQRLHDEKESREHDVKRDAITSRISELQEKLFGEAAPSPVPPLSSHQAGFFQDRLETEINNLFEPRPPNYCHEKWFDLREQESGEIREHLQEAARFSGGALRDIIESKNRVFSQRERVKERLGGVGDSPLTTELAAEIRKLTEDQGGVKERLNQAKEQVAATERGMSELGGQITDLEQQCGKSAQGKKREEMSRQVEAVIEEYLQAASSSKAEEIEKHLNKLFLKMANCRDEVKHIHLDRQGYGLAIMGKDGRERPIDTGLSEGQAQVLALAFVGALAKASGRILPTIIDTPLGRLDVNHRRDVTQNFFVGFSPQTVLLSTPTEINNCTYDGVPLHLLDDLRPYVAHAYTIERESPGVARVVPGYFGNRF